MGTETLNSYTATGITLTATGADNSPFTVTSHGTIKTSTSGVYSALSVPLLLNQGTINGSPGVFLKAGGTIDNIGASASIIGYLEGVLTQGSLANVLNSGTIVATRGIGIELAAGGTVANIGASSFIYGTSEALVVNGAAGYLNNSGTIASKNLATVLFDAGGTVVNSSASALIANNDVYIQGATGLVVNVGTISSVVDGIELKAGGTVNNIGASAVVTAKAIGIYVAGATGFVNNTGSILGSSTNFSVQLEAGGTVNNTGATAFIAGGVDILTNAGQLNNSGTITGEVNMAGGGNVTNAVSGVISTSGLGISLTKPGTVSNAGSITSSASYGIRSINVVTVLNTGASSLIFGGNGGVELAVAGDTIINAGTIAGGKYGALLLSGPASISNTGTITAGKYGVLVKAGAATISNAGTIAGPVAIDIKGTLASRVVAGNHAAFIGAVEAAGTLNTLEFSGTGTTFASIGSQFNGFQTIGFDPGSAWTISGNTIALGTTLTISGFGLHDGIDLTGFAATSDHFAANALTLSNGTTNEILDLSSSYLNPNFMLGPDSSGGTVIDVTCFCAGTRILTPSGEIPVENLKPGDLVITAGAKIRPIIWAGREDINLHKHPEPELVRPIRITAGALGQGIPERDLRLSPHHAVRVDAALVEAFSLVNHSTIFQEQAGRHVTYHHIELESHDILLAEGCPCESYLDTGIRLQAA